MDGGGVDVKVLTREEKGPLLQPYGGSRGQADDCSPRPAHTLSRLWPVTRGLLPASTHAWQGLSPFPILLTWNPRDAPQGASTAEFHMPGRGCSHHPPRGPCGPGRSCHVLAMALQPGSTVLQAGPLPQKAAGPCPPSLWRTSTPSPLFPQLHRDAVDMQHCGFGA